MGNNLLAFRGAFERKPPQYFHNFNSKTPKNKAPSVFEGAFIKTKIIFSKN
jgi:hypothetical protein